MLCSWEGNRRSGVALAMCPRLNDLSTYRLNGQERGMGTPPMLHRGMACFALPHRPSSYSVDIMALCLP